jgi:hypothetical protein
MIKFGDSWKALSAAIVPPRDLEKNLRHVSEK